MNTTTQLHKFGIAALLLGTLAFSACKDETEDVCGTPSITDVTQTTKRDTVLTGGNLADWIIIRGGNFCQVKSLFFNDLEAPLAEAYITANEITVRIPRAIPKNVTNTITVTTDGGTAQKAYTLSIPALVVRGMGNEYTAPGQTAAIVGLNFDLYGVTPEKGKVLWNGAPVAITRTTADSVFFVVPASATPGATLKVVDANNLETSVPGRYKDNRNILFGYDQGGSVWGGTAFITQGPVPTPVNGSFIRVTQLIPAWTWTEFSTSNQLPLPSAAIANPAGYVMRFEVNTLKPFSANGIKFVIDGDANTYTWVPAVPFNTRGRWSTRTVNLTDIVKTPLDATRPLHEFKFVFHGPGTLDADIAFDNFRIVPKD